MSVLHNLVRTGHCIEIIRELLKKGVDPNNRNDEGDTPLHIVASKNETHPQDVEKSLKVAEELIASEADVNIENSQMRTPLICAVRAGNCRMVEILLKAKANINHQDEDGNSVLHHTVFLVHYSFLKKGKTSTVLRMFETLFKFKPKINIRNLMGRTPLMIAVDCQTLPIVQCLLKHNASVNLFDRQKETALHHAFRNNVNMDIVFELACHGGDFDKTNRDKETPIDIYFRQLKESPNDEIDNAKRLFKFLILHKSFGPSQQEDIDRISRVSNGQLSEFTVYCMDRTKKMLRDELAPNYYVYDMALRGILKRGKKDRLDSDIFDKAFDKIIEGEYPMYGDLIASGIGSPYLNRKFAEICSDENVFREFLIFDVLYKLSFYLSYSEMLSMIVAFVAKNKWDLTSHIWNITRPIPTTQ